jgi:hypothetical protein
MAVEAGIVRAVAPRSLDPLILDDIAIATQIFAYAGVLLDLSAPAIDGAARTAA